MIFLDWEEAVFDDVNYWGPCEQDAGEFVDKRKALITRSKADDKAMLRGVLEQLKM